MRIRLTGLIILASLLTAGAALADDSGFELEGFMTPESVLHDADADVYLVSNINGSPIAKEDNGFISKVTPTGKIIDLRWIDGAREDVELHAPKGMVIVGEALYVTDIDVVRIFDRKTGAPRASIAIEGATFLNDLAATKDGVVHVSDMGVTLGPEGFEPTGTDAIWTIRRGVPSLLLKGAELGQPNGLSIDDEGRLRVATFGSAEVYEIRQGKRVDIRKAPKGVGSLDGLVGLGSSGYLVSSWEASAVYLLKDSTWTKKVSDVAAPADIGWDAKRSRLLIPKFTEGGLLVTPLAP